ncbi:MAG: hypothetical protein MJ219_02265 [Mycoplasmoidaceae bacterium]|nr:hypothetical protein [Mycoplasmoidaceae bacterium]
MSIMCDADLLPIYIVKRSSKLHRQVVVVGNKIHCKQYIAGKYPTIEEVNKITQLLQAKEQELKDYYGY